MTFLKSILNQSKKYEFPFDHWEYNNALSDEAIQEIIKADIPDVSKHNLNYDGTRAIDGGAAEFREGIASGGKAIKFRCFITKENASKFDTTFKSEIARVMIHGILHLIGYDDKSKTEKKRMREMENKFLKKVL